jgi:hypothetical protein
MMMLRTPSILIVLLGLLLGDSRFQVEAYKDDQILLETNALGYTKADMSVAYSDNYEVDHEIKGSCVNGLPPGDLLAPDAQTTKNDATCKKLVSHNTFH